MKKVPKEKDFARSQFEAMTQFVIEEYSLKDFDPHFTFSLDRRRVCSWGGYSHKRQRPFINIAGHRGRTDRVYFCNEYPHYEDDPEIGTYSGSWQQTLAGTIAHEMAHAVELFILHHHRKYSSHLKKFTAADIEDHGGLFRSIYRSLRRKFELCNLPK